MIAKIKRLAQLPVVKKYVPIILLIVFAAICLRIAFPKEIKVMVYQGTTSQFGGGNWDVDVSGCIGVRES